MMTGRVNSGAPPAAALRVSPYGAAGLAIIVLAEICLAAGLRIVGIYFTPIVWTGYILCIDALNLATNGNSLITSRRREFLAMLPWSVICWLVFEAYNLRLHNWTYIGLPNEPVLQLIGYAWSFATIFPAVLETAELITPLIAKPAQRARADEAGDVLRPGLPLLIASMILGAACLLIPLVVPESLAGKLFALVWVGFFFLLDPLNALLGGRSLLLQIARGDASRALALGASGLACGLLWEFWNYWAAAKWVYTVPISFAGPRLFEMPLLGFLGFIPFALECFVMQETLLSIAPSLSGGRRS